MKIRGLFLAACLLALGGIVAPQHTVAADNGLSLIPDFFTDTVTVIDTSTQTVLTTLDLPVDTYARSGALSPDGSKFYVGGFFSGFIVPIDVDTLTVGAPLVGVDPDSTVVSGISFSPDGSRVYAGNLFRDQLIIIDPTTDTPLEILDNVCGAPREPAEVRATEDAVYFSCIRYGSFNGISSIRRLDRDTLVITDVAEVGRSALTFDIHLPSQRLYAVNAVDASISVVDLVSGLVIETITGLTSSSSINPDDAGGISVSPDGETLYLGVVNGDDRGLLIIDLASGARTTVSTGGGVVAVDQSSSGDVLYAVGSGTSDVAVIDTESNTLDTVIETPGAEGAIVWGDFLRNVVAFTPGVFAIRGVLENLDEGDTVTLQLNSGDDLVLDENGAFTFTAGLLDASAYTVTVLDAPAGEECVVFNGVGVINSADVTDLRVDCNTNDPDGEPDVEDISGRLSGLADGLTVVLQNNGVDDLVLGANGEFTFATPVPDGGAYAVTVATQPVGQTCSVTNAAGTADKDVTNIAVLCSANRFSVGGSLQGLAGGAVVLQNVGGDDLTLDVNAAFTFAAPVREGDPYSVTVATQPVDQTCVVTDGVGTVTGAVTNVVVDCLTNRYSIGGTLSGLDGGEQVILQNNGGDDLTLTANGVFSFALTEFTGDPYSVTVLSAPIGKDCTVASASGNVNAADVTDVAVVCVAPPPDPAPDIETIGGTLSGLTDGESVVLQNNGADDLLLTTNGAFVFATGIADGSDYLVTVAQQPDSQICTVASGAGTATRDVGNITINCVTITFPIGGSVSGLAEGASLVLQNNSGDDRSISADGGFVFATELVTGTSYSVAILTQPDGQTCSIENGSGTANDAVTDVAITCSNDLSAAFSSVRAEPFSTEAGTDILLEVLVRDTAGVRAAGVPVSVSVDSASVDSAQVTIASSPTMTDSRGRAQFTLRSSIAQDVSLRVSFNPDLFIAVSWSPPVVIAPQPIPVLSPGALWLLVMAIVVLALRALPLAARITHQRQARPNPRDTC